MYRYDQEAPRKLALTRKLIRKNLSRRLKGLLLLVTIILILGSIPLIPLTSLFMEDGLSLPLIFPLLFYGGILGIYIFSFVRLWRLHHTELSVRRDTVSSIRVYEFPRYESQERRQSTVLYFTSGGVYRAARLMARDGIGDEFYVICHAEHPDRILDIYRTTEYEWSHNRE